MNLWHEIDPGTKEQMDVIVEINKGSKNKYEIVRLLGTKTDENAEAIDKDVEKIQQESENFEKRKTTVSLGFF
jgi:hypothetical protein